MKEPEHLYADRTALNEEQLEENRKYWEWLDKQNADGENRQVDAVVIPLPKEVKMVQILVDRLNDYERQLKSDCYLNRQKISHKVKELKKCIQLIQSV